MGLAQILVVQAVALVILLGLTTFNDQLAQTATRIQQKSEVVDLKRTLHMALATEPFCRCNMPNTNFDSAVAQPTVALNELKLHKFVFGVPCSSPDSPPPVDFLKTGGRFGSLTVDSIDWRNIKLASAGRYVATLQIDLSSQGNLGHTVTIDGVVLLTSPAGGSMLKVDGCRFDGEKIYLGINHFTHLGPRNVGTTHQASFDVPATSNMESAKNLAAVTEVGFIQAEALCEVEGKNNTAEVDIEFLRGGQLIFSTSVCKVEGWSNIVPARLRLTTFFTIPAGADTVKLKSILAAPVANPGPQLAKTESQVYGLQ